MRSRVLRNGGIQPSRSHASIVHGPVSSHATALMSSSSVRVSVGLASEGSAVSAAIRVDDLVAVGTCAALGMTVRVKAVGRVMVNGF